MFFFIVLAPVVAGRGRGPGRANRAPVDVNQLEAGRRKTEDGVPPVIRPFTQQTGPTTHLPPNAKPLEFYSQIFEEDFFEIDGRGNKCERANTPLATADAVWHPTTGKAMMAFVATHVLMDIRYSRNTATTGGTMTPCCMTTSLPG